MKCENCGSELIGAAIVCRQCNHNNAQGRVSQWRARRTGELQPLATQPPTTRTISPLAAPAAAAKPEVKRPGAESRQIEPKGLATVPAQPKVHASSVTPSSVRPSASTPPKAQTIPVIESDSEVLELPPWRMQLKEKVKQVRESRVGAPPAASNEPDEAQLDQNPIVESALKRIRWSNQTPQPAATPRINRGSAQAAALAEEPGFDAEPPAKTEPKPPARSLASPAPKAEAQPTVKTTTYSAPDLTVPMPARRADTKSVNKAETRPVAPRQTAPTNPATKQQPAPKSEDRAGAKPVQTPAVATTVKADAKPATDAVPKIRTTGELKQPPKSAPPQTSPQVAQAAAAPARKTIETQVIGLTPTVANIAGYASIGAATTARPPAATLWARTLAGACDFEIVVVTYLPLFTSYATLDTSVGGESLAILFGLLATLMFCYQVLTLTIANRTSGMAFLQLQLINIGDAEKPVSFRKKLMRAAAATPAALCPPLNLLVMQLNQHGYSLPDLFSNTTLTEK